jgi:hypothetical protein
MKTETTLDHMAHLAGEMTEVALAGQAVGLRLLAAEMEALAHLMPGSSDTNLAPSATDAEIEADFDNMPV